MDFILNEAIEERKDDFKLVFSDDSEEEYSEEEEQLDSINEDEMLFAMRLTIKMESKMRLFIGV